MDERPPRICFDRFIPDHHLSAHAMVERVLARAPELAHDGEQDPNAVGMRLRMAIVDTKKWQNGKVLRCRFLDGSETQQARVTEKAQIWEKYANIRLNFVSDGDAEIRISFQADSGSWSAIGQDALLENYFPRYQPTMNFGWLEDETEDQEYERVVVHEFGHALGCIHEHQSPVAVLKWNREAVLRYFSGPPNYWNRAAIDHNVLQRYSKNGMHFTRFDPDSIMLYMFPAVLFTDHRATNNNTRLSAKDKAFIAEMYPRGGPRGERASDPIPSLGSSNGQRAGQNATEALQQIDQIISGVLGRSGNARSETADPEAVASRNSA